jgi:hypothetical protein
MNCQRAQRLLSEYHDHLLAPRKAAALAAHLQHCPVCRALRQALTAFEAQARATSEWQPAPPPHLGRDAVRRWMTERDRRIGRPVFFADRVREGLQKFGFRLAPGAAVVVLMCAVFALYGWKPRPSAPVHPLVQARTSPSAASLRALRPRPAFGPRMLPPEEIAPGGARTPLRPDDHWSPPHPRTAGPPPSMTPSSAWRDPATTASGAADDLLVLNGGPSLEHRRSAPLPRDAWDRIEARVRATTRVSDDFVTIPFPRLAAASDRAVVAATEAYQREAAVIDARLAREVTVAAKATALSDLCDRLRADTGIQLTAGPSVADEKVTIFCEKMPLREVMRQLSRPFGYTWLRSKREGGEYRYELVQDLKSQLLEEELRNRDRNEALIALEREIDRYRPYLSLSPDQALARSKAAPPEEKKLLEKLAGQGWGPLQMYSRLTLQEMAALRAGHTLTFVQGEKAGDAVPEPSPMPLPPELAQGILQSQRGYRMRKQGGEIRFAPADAPDGVPPAAMPELRPVVTLTVKQSEPGRFILDGESGFYTAPNAGTQTGNGPYAVGQSPLALAPNNRAANLQFSHDPALQRRVSLEPRSSCKGDLSPAARSMGARSPGREGEPEGQTRRAGQTAGAEARVSSADVLEELHHATGLPIVSDYYTRLYRPESVRVRNELLFDTLNQVADAMRLRWHREAGAWLRFRSASFYDDRRKEVPNRLLARWAAVRRQQGALPLDELIEMAKMSDAQLDAAEMAEGVRECWGLPEWEVARKHQLRPHLGCLALLTPAQRQTAMSPGGLALTRMSLSQQERFIALPLAGYLQAMESLEEVMGTTLHVAYTQPGGFGMKPFDGPWTGASELALVHEPTREAALQAVHRIAPQVTEGQIVPSELAVTIVYERGTPQAGFRIVIRTTAGGFRDWFGSFP